MCGKMDTFNGLEKLVSNIKGPIWFREKVDFNAICLIREFLQKCSNDKIVEMLKNILSVEERMGLGGKYLFFVSSRSVKLRGFSFLSLYNF